jgi:hypothetical protein
MCNLGYEADTQSQRECQSTRRVSSGSQGSDVERFSIAHS